VVSQGIKEIKKRFNDVGIRGLALDIDETLSWTIGHYIKELQILFGNPEKLSIEEMAKKYRYTQNVPYWQNEGVDRWVDEHINDNEFQCQLTLIKDSDHFVNRINKVIPVVAYLTIRPESVVEGTSRWLRKNGFPEANVIARPNDIPREKGNNWKAEVLEYLYPNILGLVDDNLAVVNNLSTKYHGKIFLYNNKDVPIENKNVFACPKWSDVYSTVIKEFEGTYTKNESL
jgi:hypothetical protein